MNRQPKRRVLTLKAVAEAVGGLHPSTVSRALRNCPGVSKKLAARIQAVARDLGYVPDPLLADFNAHRLALSEARNTPVIAFVTETSSRASWELLPGHLLLWESASRTAEDLHAKLEFFASGSERGHAGKLNEILLARGIEGVVFSATPGQTTAPDLDWEHFASVKIEGDACGGPKAQVAADHRLALRSAWKHLRTQGLERLGLLAPADWPCDGRDQLLAGYTFEETQRSSALPIPILETPSPAKEEVANWVTKHRLQAVLSPTERGFPLLKEAGIPGPEACNFVCLRLLDPSSGYTGMQPDLGTIADLAVAQVITQLRANQKGLSPYSSCTYVASIWHEGMSSPLRMSPRR